MTATTTIALAVEPVGDAIIIVVIAASKSRAGYVGRCR
jgi:hypothetical protein